MSSQSRTLMRRNLRKASDYTPKSQPTKAIPNGGYATLTANGWKQFAMRRLMAISMIASMRDAIAQRLGRFTSKPAASFHPTINRHTDKPHTHAREIARHNRQAAA